MQKLNKSHKIINFKSYMEKTQWLPLSGELSFAHTLPVHQFYANKRCVLEPGPPQFYSCQSSFWPDSDVGVVHSDCGWRLMAYLISTPLSCSQTSLHKPRFQSPVNTERTQSADTFNASRGASRKRGKTEETSSEMGDIRATVCNDWLYMHCAQIVLGEY